MDTASRFAELCWVYFLNPRAYYYLRISYATHARLNRREAGVVLGLEAEGGA